jgi:hypothetical protein
MMMMMMMRRRRRRIMMMLMMMMLTRVAGRAGPLPATSPPGPTRSCRGNRWDDEEEEEEEEEEDDDDDEEEEEETEIKRRRRRKMMMMMMMMMMLMLLLLLLLLLPIMIIVIIMMMLMTNDSLCVDGPAARGDGAVHEYDHGAVALGRETHGPAPDLLLRVQRLHVEHPEKPKAVVHKVLPSDTHPAQLLYAPPYILVITMSMVRLPPAVKSTGHRHANDCCHIHYNDLVLIHLVPIPGLLEAVRHDHGGGPGVPALGLRLAPRVGVVVQIILELY